MRWPGCRHDNPAGAKFCLECGQRFAPLFDATGRPDEPRADARRLLEQVAAGLTGAPDLLRAFKASPAHRAGGAS